MFAIGGEMKIMIVAFFAYFSSEASEASVLIIV